MKFVSSKQIQESLQALSSFRSKVGKQGVQHVLPFLALKRKGVNPVSYIPYAESDDFEFFNKYLKIGDGEKPYFDPIAGLFRISTHPHSNIATARKGTFFRSWNAAVMQPDPNTREERWKFQPPYLQIIAEKALTKASTVSKVPAIPLAVFLFRNEPISDDAQVDFLAARLRKEFSLSNEEFKALFDLSAALSAFGSKPLDDSEVLEAINLSGVLAEVRDSRTDYHERLIDDNDEILKRVRSLIFEDGYAGVIFVGPPGTSKSWYAVQIALALADGDPTRVTKIQFHKSFQYENFIEGFVPNIAGNGFELREQVMLQVIRCAEANPSATHVVLIDELNRSDPGRVFGELLTYLEPSRRGEVFRLAYGREISIPANIIFIATMNSRDKSVLEMDDAFERRMCKIEFNPKSKILESVLRENQAPEALIRRIVGFFEWIGQRYPLGHTYFFAVRDEAGLARLWDTQLRFVFQKHFKYESDVLREIESQFVSITGARPES